MKNWTYKTLAGLDMGSAASVTDWFDARSYGFVMFLVKWSAGGAGAGAFRVEATVHESKEPSTVEDITSVITTTYGAWPSINLLLDSASVPLSKPFPFMRLALDMSVLNAEREMLAYAFGRRES